jgi:hypothetical protein
MRGCVGATEQVQAQTIGGVSCSAVATVAGVPLPLDEDDFSAGAGFRLAPSEGDPASFELESDARVVVHPEAGVVIASLKDSEGTGFLEAHEAAQQALDLYAYMRGSPFALLRREDEVAFIQWWRDASGVTLRSVVEQNVGVRLRAAGTVTRADGEVVPPPAPPRPSWTAALRFFRYAQLADDVFEAYRSMFLAFEAILSARVEGGPSGERAWLRHALDQLAASGELEPPRYLADAGPGNPVDALLEEQWAALRCATFHAKAHREVLLPGSAEDRDTVRGALERLSRLVVDLCKSVVGASRPGGALTDVGFEVMYIAPKVGTLEMRLERRDDADQVADAVDLSPSYLGRLIDDPGEHGFCAELVATGLGRREFNALTVNAPGGTGLAAGPLNRTFEILAFEPSGAARIELMLAFVLNNLQLPKSRFLR